MVFWACNLPGNRFPEHPADGEALIMSGTHQDFKASAPKLVYVTDTRPGITRLKAGKGFRYLDADGCAIKDTQLIERFNALAIPPAYEHVWICPNANGHIQATGRDARGRKQYRYHEQWKAVRDANKYEQLAQFGRALPRIRRRVMRDLNAKTMTHDKIAAVVVRLLELTLIRVGTIKYAKTNNSYGLTTLRRRHAVIVGSRVRFRFKGKSGVAHDVTINDRRIAAVIKRCMEIPGQELFQYQDTDGNIQSVDSGSVNAYLKTAAGGEFTAKHYRTWAASVFAMSQLQRHEPGDDASMRSALNDVVKDTAVLLGNTPAVCRECYIHPALMDAYLDGKLPQRKTTRTPSGLNADERRFLAFLENIGDPL